MIFIVGNSRSGTTMLGRVFGMHSLVHTFPELQVFERLIDPEDIDPDVHTEATVLVALGARIFSTIRDGIFREREPERFEPEIRSMIEARGLETPTALYRNLLQDETEAHGKSIPCEQTPRYMFTASNILTAFPDAHVVHIYRDPRDVLLSQKNRWRRRFLTKTDVPLKRTFLAWSNYHPSLTARLWGSVMREADILADHPRFSEVQYEHLLREPESRLRTLCGEIGIAFETAMLNIRREGSSANQDEAGSTGFDPSRIGSWKNGGLSSAEIAICESRLGPIMAARGYTPSGRAVNPLRKLFVQVALPIKVVAGIAMNAGRFRNLLKTVLRRL
jgi:hypothetical protein